VKKHLKDNKLLIREELIFVASKVEVRLLAIETLAFVPCFKCLIGKKVTPFFCDPEKCESLETWLIGNGILMEEKLKNKKGVRVLFS